MCVCYVGGGSGWVSINVLVKPYPFIVCREQVDVSNSNYIS